MKNQKVIDILNRLIELNNDRMAGYETAKKETDERVLMSVFNHLSQSSWLWCDELSREVRRLGGRPTKGKTKSGKMYNTWMDIRLALSRNEREKLLILCDNEESLVVSTYREALWYIDDFTIEQTRMIENQYYQIQADHERVKSLGEPVLYAHL